MLVAESAALALTLAFVARSGAIRFALCVACIMLFTIAGGRWRGRSITSWLTTGARWASRRPTHAAAPADPLDAVLADADGVVAIVELVDTRTLITTASMPLPRLDMGGSRGPVVAAQLLILASPARWRVLMSVRAGGDGITWTAETLNKTLESAMRRVCRRMDAQDIVHRRLVGPDLAAAGAGPDLREAWDGLTGPANVQATVRATLGPGGMTSVLLGQLTQPSTANIALTWSGTDATLRLMANSRAEIDQAITRLRTIIPIIRLDGDHLDGLRATLPIAWPGRARTSRDVSPQTQGLALRPSGIAIGHDRSGEAIYLQIRTDRDRPVRICVVGGPRAAQLIAGRAVSAGIRGLVVDPVSAGGNPAARRVGQVGAAEGVRTAGGGGTSGPNQAVPFILHVLDRPTPADAGVLTGADVVVCQPLSAGTAAMVTAALGLSPRVTEWLTQIEGDMAALIGEGAVRWVMLAPS
jgi:hypothetical protein